MSNPTHLTVVFPEPIITGVIIEKIGPTGAPGGGEGGSSPTNLTASYTASNVTIISSSGSDVILAAAAETQAGIMTAADKVLVNTITTKAPLASPALTGNPTAPTPLTADDSTKLATTAHVQAVVRALIGLAPAELDTLAEIATALAANTSSDAALVATVSGKLAKAANLSDLTNAATARANLILGNVENVALSTWAGSVNIATLGTIGTGTWNGSVIGPAYLGTGTRDGTKYLRDDGTWQVVSGGSATQAFGSVVVSGQTTVVADAAPDALTFVAGTGIVITTNATTDTITFTLGTHGHTSAQVSDATNLATGNTVVRRDSGGGAIFTTLVCTEIAPQSVNIQPASGPAQIALLDNDSISFAYIVVAPNSLGGDVTYNCPNATGYFALTASSTGVPNALANGTVSGTLAIDSTTITFGTGSAAAFRTALGVVSSFADLAAGVTTATMTLGENTGIALDPAGSADEKWTGTTIAGTAGASMVSGDLIYLDATATKWLLADADAASTSGDVPLGLCVTASAADGTAIVILLHGTMRSAAFPASLTLGAPLYVSTTAGDITATQPSGTDDVIRRVGWAITAEPNTILFNPSNDYTTHT